MKDSAIIAIPTSLLAGAILLAAGACGGDDDAGGEASPDAQVTADAEAPRDDAAADGGGADAGPPLFGSSLNGTVLAAAHSGKSWYLGGELFAVQPLPAPSLFALDATGAPLATCDLAGGFDGEIHAVVSAGTSLYVGGLFSHYKGASAKSLAKLDLATCALDTTFSPAADNGVKGGVNALAVSGTSLYVGGEFSTYRTTGSASSLAKLDLASGALDTTFSPPASNGVERAVYALAVSGTSLFVGGEFTSYRGDPTMNLAKVDATSGVLDSTFSPPGFSGFDQAVRALVVSGTSLLVGGDFANYLTVPESALRYAKLDVATGAIDPKVTGVGFDGSVRALAVSGGSVFVGGTFTNHTAGSASRLAKLDLATSTFDTTFSPAGKDRNGVDGEVTALAVFGGSVYAGGRFAAHRHNATSTAVGNVVKLDPTTGDIQSTLTPAGHDVAGVDDRVIALAASASTLWVGGAFHSHGGHRVGGGLVKVDDTTFQVDRTFNPPKNLGFDGAVTSVAISGTSIYVGGRFTTYRGVPNSARHLAKLDLTTGDIDTKFSPPGPTENGVDGEVDALAISGTSLFVGGQFSKYRFVDGAKKLVKVSLATGELDPTFRGTTLGGQVEALAVSGSSLYVGGTFTDFVVPAAGIPSAINSIEKVDVATGVVDGTFATNVDPAKAGFASVGFPHVSALAVAGSSLYVGGSFDAYLGVENAAINLAKLDLTSGNLDTTFSPAGAAANGVEGTVYALAASGDSLYVGGDFFKYRGADVSRIAKVDLTSGALDAAFAKPGGKLSDLDGRLAALAVDGDTLLAGGEQGYFGGQKWLAHLAILNAKTGLLR